jgi:hypothetical protein
MFDTYADPAVVVSQIEREAFARAVAAVAARNLGEAFIGLPTEQSEDEPQQLKEAA